MKSIVIYTYIALLLTFSSCHSFSMQDEKDIKHCCELFCNNLYNYRLQKACIYCTPESKKWIKYIASNITEHDVLLIDSMTSEASVKITDINFTSDTLATATVNVNNYLRLDTIGKPLSFCKEKKIEILLIKRNKQWKVKMEGQLRNAM